MEAQRRVADGLRGHGQTLISVADESHVPPAASAVWEVRAGEVKQR